MLCILSVNIYVAPQQLHHSQASLEKDAQKQSPAAVSGDGR